MEAVEKQQVSQVTSLLKWTYGLVPILAGLDKFTNLLTDWEKYIAPVVLNVFPFAPETFMYMVGIIEIVAGIIVFMQLRIGALIVGLWLCGIVLNLLLTGQYLDIAVRDATMAMGAFSLYMLLGRKDAADRPVTEVPRAHHHAS